MHARSILQPKLRPLNWLKPPSRQTSSAFGIDTLTNANAIWNKWGHGLESQTTTLDWKRHGGGWRGNGSREDWCRMGNSSWTNLALSGLPQAYYSFKRRTYPKSIEFKGTAIFISYQNQLTAHIILINNLWLIVDIIMIKNYITHYKNLKNIYNKLTHVILMIILITIWSYNY